MQGVREDPQLDAVELHDRLQDEGEVLLRLEGRDPDGFLVRGLVAAALHLDQQVRVQGHVQRRGRL